MMIARLGLGGLALAAFAAQASALEISSPSVANDKWDAKYLGDAAGCGGKSVSIALAWKDPPAGTRSYALTMFDPDANGAHTTRISRSSSPVSAWVIPTNEELMIARHTGRLLGLVDAPARRAAL